MARGMVKRVIKERREVKIRYLAGESVPSLAKSFDCTIRNVYYLIGGLSIEEKTLHTKNRWLRKLALPITTRQMPVDHTQELNGRPKVTIPEDLDVFIQG